MCGAFDSAMAFCVPIADDYEIAGMCWIDDICEFSDDMQLLASLAFTAVFSNVPPTFPLGRERNDTCHHGDK